MKKRNEKQKRVVTEIVKVIIVWQIILVFTAAASSLPAGRIAKDRCQDKCGDAIIPYPFGIGPGCYHNPWFEVECPDHKIVLKKLALNNTSITKGSPKINWEAATVTVGTTCIASTLADSDESSLSDLIFKDLRGTPFLFSSNHNVLLVSGCGGATTLLDSKNKILAGCASICINESMPRIDCFGFGCCQAPIISPSFDYFNLKVSALPQRNFTYTMLVDKDWIANKSKDFDLSDSICAKAQVVLDWIIQDLPVKDPSYANSSCVNKTTSAHGAGGYVCRCKDGFYEGNPYLPNGCQVVKECEGCVDQCILLPNHSFGCGKKGSATTLFVGLGLGIGSMLAILGAYWLYRVMKRKRNSKLKANNFERNGGLLLKQKILSSNNKTEKIKIFNSDELDKATDEYNEERILGRGGQGTVYKGMLNDGKIVAIKKSVTMNESLLDVFINEVVLLSQINHRNVVNLLGCCLESEVPMLVYEYVPCGTLSQHIHASKQEIPMPWEMHLQIGTDIANALAYLHSSYFVPIFHRDIKSSNILLDEKYRAKLSDFGISKSVTVDQTHFTTDHIVGTYGYLDPEYFISNRFTDKSDVFSFGVVLVELLTGQKAIRSEKDERGLAAWFLRHIGDSKLYETLDARVVKEGNEKEIMGVAQLAKRCLSMDGKGRPAMKEVAAELETIRSSLQHGLARNQSFISVEFNDSQPSSSIDISLEE